MTYVKQTWTDGATLVDAAHLAHIEQGIADVDTAAAKLPPIISNSAPGAPVDGMTWLLPLPTTIVSPVNPTSACGAWLFRYNATALGPKWQFIGGSPLTVVQPASSGLPLSVWTPLEPSVAVPFTGRYVIGAQATFQPPTAAQIYLSFTVDGTNPGGPTTANSVPNGGTGSCAVSGATMDLVVGAVLSFCCWANVAATLVNGRYMSVSPIAIAG